MDLLKKMLETDPSRRITSKDALSHPAFLSVLSKSPLISKNYFNADSLIQHTKLTEEYSKKQKPEDSRKPQEGLREDP